MHAPQYYVPLAVERYSLIAIAFLTPIAGGVSADDAPSYTLVTLPAESGGTVSPMAVNEDRQAVFTKIVVPFPGIPAFQIHSGHAWDPELGQQVVLGPAGTSGRVFDINENGTVAGILTHTTSGSISIPFLWDGPTGATIIFPSTFELPELVRTLALNDLGQVVGTISNTLIIDAFDQYGFYWDGISDPLPLPEFRRATDLNNLGQIVGQSSDTKTAQLRNSDGTFIDLGALPGDSESIANDINELGIVVGASIGVNQFAFLWSDGTMTPLDPTGMFTSSAAHSINDAGQVVGTATLPNGQSSGFLWEDGALWVLNDLVESLCTPGITCQALDINNRGDIIGHNLADNFLLMRDAPTLAGDINGDGTVDAADYVVWRKNDSSAANYNEWRAHFGQTTAPVTTGSAGTDATVPEPISFGIGTNPNRQAEAWLAIPEPASAWLLAAAALLVGATAGWRYSRQSVPLVTSRRGKTALVGLFASLGVAHAGAPANAQVITFQFAGVIDESASNLVDVGDAFTGTFDYDLNHSDINVEDPTRGEYFEFLWPTGLTWAVGPFFFDGPWSHITIFDTEVDSLTYRGTDFSSGQRGTIHLADPTGAVFFNDHLPEALELADFVDRRFDGRGVDEDFGIHNFSGHIDALQLVSISNPSDFNNNGSVDAADYVAWRKFNNTATTLPNDSTPGTDDTDYAVWRSTFGSTQSGRGGGTIAAGNLVPEPPTITVLLLAIGAIAGRHRSR
jgi:probable HAF family extracellular repeat protein